MPSATGRVYASCASEAAGARRTTPLSRASDVAGKRDHDVVQDGVHLLVGDRPAKFGGALEFVRRERLSVRVTLARHTLTTRSIASLATRPTSLTAPGPIRSPPSPTPPTPTSSVLRSSPRAPPPDTMAAAGRSTARRGRRRVTPSTLITSWSELQAHVASGAISLVRDAEADFRCPVLGNPEPIG